MTAPDAVLSAIPGWESASWTEQPGGLSNRSYLLRQNGNRALLKIDPSPRTQPYNSRREEFEIQARAASARLACRPLYASECVYLSEYVEGRVATVTDLQNIEWLAALAGALRRLHDLPRHGRGFDALAAAELYARAIGPDKQAAATGHIEIIRTTPQSPQQCFCHNDLVAGNILIADSIRFLDWEFACDNDPLFDLATIVAHHDLDARCTDILMAEYFGTRFERDRDWLVQRLNEQMCLYRSLLWLWNSASCGKAPLLPTVT